MPKYSMEIGGKTYDIESDRPLSDTDLMSYASKITAPTTPAETAPLRTWAGSLGDTAVTGFKGAVGLIEAGLGLADIPANALGLYAPSKTLAGLGLRPAEAQKALDEMYSDAQQAAEKKVKKAEGFTDTLKALAQNPSVIATTAGQALPQMLGGMGIARGAMAVAPKLSPLIAGAIGEGTLGAGSAMQNISEAMGDVQPTPGQAGLALLSGAGTAGLGILGARAAKALGGTDIDTMLAQGARRAATEGAETVGKTVTKVPGGTREVVVKPPGFLSQMARSGLSEGVFEELPQSVQEQIIQNYALDKPLLEGVGKAAAMGLTVGTAMGVAGGGYSALGARARPEAPITDKSRAANTVEQTPDGQLKILVNGVADTPPDAPEVQEVRDRLTARGFSEEDIDRILAERAMREAPAAVKEPTDATATTLPADVPAVTEAQPGVGEPSVGVPSGDLGRPTTAEPAAPVGRGLERPVSPPAPRVEPETTIPTELTETPSGTQAPETIQAKEEGSAQPAAPAPTAVEAPAPTPPVEEKPARYQRLRAEQPWYSALSKAIEESPQKAAPAPQWKNVLTGMVNKGQAKRDEIEWTGLEDWLALQQGRVTKEQVQDYLKQGGVKVEETVLGTRNFTPAEKQELQDLNERYRLSEAGEEVEFSANDFNRLQSLEEGGEGTKYSQYTLPGGENYREVLLTLPVSANRIREEATNLAKQAMSAGTVAEFDRLNNQSRDLYRQAVEVEKTKYQSSHWDQPNVLAHIRVNDRTDADGKKVLFVEEIQSDWGQEGKKKGFADPSKKPVSKKEFDAYTDKLLDEYIERQVQSGEDRQEAGRRGIDMPLPQMAQELGRAEEYARMRAGRDMDRSGEVGIPSAPFVTKTEGWLNLALKRVLTMAAEGGYDRVAFINGAQAHRRFPEKEDGTSTKESFDKYYNQIIPQALNKLLPKVGGGKVGQVNIAQKNDNMFGIVVDGVLQYRARTREQAEEIVKAEYGPWPDTKIVELDKVMQPGFDITPAMREKLAAGLPLFQKEDKEQPPQETGKYPLPAQAIEDLKGNNLALALEAIETSKPSEINKAIAARLKVLLKNTQVTIDDDLRDSKGNPVLGAASTSGSRIWLDANRGMNMETVLHESVHAATERILSTPEDQRTPQQNEAVRELTDLWNAAKANNDIKLTPEASDSLSEFVAEGMTNIELQDQLASVKWESRTMWAGFKRILLNMLGVKTPASMLDYTLASVDTIFAAVPKAAPTAPAQTTTKPVPKAKQTETKAFKDWFGDSKIVDENGEPLVLYRGVRGEAPGALNAEPRDDYNTFLSSSPAVAATYGMPDSFSGESGSILPVYVKADRLIEFPVTKDKYGYNKFDKIGFDRRAATLRSGEVLVARQVIDIGPMGPEAYAVDPEKKYSYPSDIYALGKGTSVKSATGNIGTFDVTSPDIRYQKPKLTAEEKAKKEAEEADAKVTEAMRKFAESKTSEEAAKAASTLQSLRSSTTAIPQLRRLYDSLSNLGRRGLVQALPTDFLAELASKNVPELQRTTSLLGRMSGMREQLLHGASQTSDRISRAFKKDPLLRGRLEEVVYVSTLAQIDPSTNKVNPRLNTLYNALGEEGKALYKEVRDYYTDMGDLYSQLIKSNVERSGASEEAKSAILAKLKVMFEPANRMRPYFPLMREGNYWFSSGKGKNRRFHMFETMPERDAALEAFARSEGKSLQDMKETSEVKFGNDVSSLREISQNTDQSLTDVLALVDKLDTGSAASKKELLDSVYQMYLNSLPEQSFRKHYITREGVAGFRTDFLRNFSQSAIQMSGQLARVKYGPQIRASLSGAKASIENQPQYEPYVEEMTKRAERDLVPPARTSLDAVSDVLTKWTYIHYLSSASSALLQPVGILQTALPVLGGRYGYGKTAAEVAKLAKVWDSFSTTRNLPDGTTTMVFPTVANSKAVNASPLEKQAIKEMLARDVSQSTMARELYGYRAKPTDRVNTKLDKGIKGANFLMGGLMHHTERVAREIVFLASYRLNIEAGKSHEAAVDAAVKDTQDSLGNYSQYARPLIMRNPVGKVVLQFSTYPLHIASFLINNFYKMIPILNKEGKAEAAKIFFGTLGTTWILAGAAGFPAPVSAVLMGFISVMFKALGDDDEMPDELRSRDFPMWFNTVWLPSQLGHIEVFGHKLSDVVKTGIVNVAGWDFASRTGLNNLFLREQKETKTPREGLQAALIDKSGPSINMILSYADGVQAFKEGDYQRAVEKIAPAAVRSVAQTYKFATEGAKDIKGNELITKGDFTTGELIGRFIGFQPSKLANLQKVNAEVKQEETKMNNERNLILRKYDIAKRKDADLDSIFEEIDAYNAKYPTNAISGFALSRYLKDKAKERAKSQQGVTVTKKTPIDVREMIDLSR